MLWQAGCEGGAMSNSVFLSQAQVQGAEATANGDTAPTQYLTGKILDSLTRAHSFSKIRWS